MADGHRVLQFFDATSSTFSYVLYDRVGGHAVVIDPVDTAAERDLRELGRLGLQLSYVLETHVHADHVTSAAWLRERTGAKVAVPVRAGVDGADRQLGDGDELAFGDAPPIRAIATPGHTSSSNSYLWNGCVFTGDALFIDACGRTDFQGGDAGELFDSVTQKLFTLPGETLVYPAHDYRGQHVSTIAYERANNARLARRSREEFIALMGSLNLPMPKLIDVAVPANLRLGAARA